MNNMFGNPKQYVMNMIAQNPMIKNNPILQNALQLAEKGNEQGLKELANNVTQSKGMNLQDIMSHFGIK